MKLRRIHIKTESKIQDEKAGKNNWSAKIRGKEQLMSKDISIGATVVTDDFVGVVNDSVSATMAMDEQDDGVVGDFKSEGERKRKS